MKKIILFLIVGLFLISLTSAETSYIFGKNNNVDLKIRCFDENNVYCSNTTNCQVSIIKPNGNNLVNNQSMTTSNTFFNYSLNTSDTNDLGVYSVVGTCQGSNNSKTTFTFEVTPNGAILDTPKSILYGISLFFLIFFFVLTLYITGRLPPKVEYNEERELISVNQIAYLRPILYWVAYLEVLGLMFIVSNITGAYSGDTMISSFTYNLFLIMGKMLLPITVLWICYLLYQAVMHKQLQTELQRGIVG